MIVSVLFVGLVPVTVFACMCDTLGTEQERLERSSVVFAGTLATTSNTSVFTLRMTFKVTEVWKGSVEQYISVDSGAMGMCGWGAADSVEYVIYARVNPNGALQTSSCSGNTPISASNIRAEIGPGTIPTASAEIEQTEPTVQQPKPKPVDTNTQMSQKKPVPREDNVFVTPTIQYAPETKSFLGFFLQSVKETLLRLFGRN